MAAANDCARVESGSGQDRAFDSRASLLVDSLVVEVEELREKLAHLCQYAPNPREYDKRAPLELDALHPSDLTKTTKAALESVYDMSEVGDEKAKEEEQRKLLREMRRRVEDVVYGEWPEVFAEGEA
jgi:hypothetical protein